MAEIRIAAYKDKEFVEKLDRENMELLRESYGKECKYKKYQFFIPMYESFIPKKCFIIEDKEQIGFAYFNNPGNKLEVWSFQIKKEFQRKGFGTQIMKYLIAYAKQKKLKKICLEAYYKNQKAINFYKKIGFKEVGSKRPDKIAFEYLLV